MSGDEIQASNPKTTVGKAWIIYLTLLVIFIVLFTQWRHVTALIAIIDYLVSGFILNRIVLRNLISWHPMYNTLENVSSTKLRMLLFWPIRYPAMFIKLAIDQHL